MPHALFSYYVVPFQWFEFPLIGIYQQILLNIYLLEFLMTWYLCKYCEHKKNNKETMGV